jgi:hypothetical protein
MSSFDYKPRQPIAVTRHNAGAQMRTASKRFLAAHINPKTPKHPTCLNWFSALQGLSKINPFLAVQARSWQ